MATPGRALIGKLNVIVPACLSVGARTSGMKTAAVFLLLLSGLCVHAAEGVTTNLVVTPSEVDPKSVTLFDNL